MFSSTILCMQKTVIQLLNQSLALEEAEGAPPIRKASHCALWKANHKSSTCSNIIHFNTSQSSNQNIGSIHFLFLNASCTFLEYNLPSLNKLNGTRWGINGTEPLFLLFSTVLIQAYADGNTVIVSWEYERYIERSVRRSTRFLFIGLWLSFRKHIFRKSGEFRKEFWAQCLPNADHTH